MFKAVTATLFIWSICIRYSCEDTVCPTLVVENAAVNCSNGHYNGTHCEVVCHTGYRPRMNRNNDHLKTKRDSKIITTCTNGKWNKQVSCEPIDCCPPDHNHIYHATFNCSHGTTYRKNCTFQCQLPAILKGNNVITCMEDGLWSFPEAICELSCKAPPSLTSADLQTSRCKSDKNKVGTTCKYKCKVGHHVLDASRKIRKKAFKIQCTKDGYWTEGDCVPVTCEPPPIKFIGLYHCTHGFQYNSECRLPCEESSTQLDPGHNVIRCQKNGTWSGNFHLCDSIKGPCELPHLSITDALVINCGQGFEIGAECNVTCLDDEKKEVVIMPYNVTERNLEHWMNPTRVQRIICTGRHLWYPPLEELVCFKRCEPFIADNYCDGGNNSAFCGYDGGDCCASTVKTKMVIPFPAGCDVQDKCACRDPKAKENTKGNNLNVQRLGSARLERLQPKADWKT